MDNVWAAAGCIFGGVTLAWGIFIFIFKENQTFIKESLKEIKSNMTFILHDVGQIKTREAVQAERLSYLEKQILKQRRR